MLVLLTEWEWACCGEPFAVGDDVELMVVAPDAWVTETYGDLGRRVDMCETHHEIGDEDPTPWRVRGRVRSIDALYLAHTVHVERREAEDVQKLRADEEALRARSIAAGAESFFTGGPISPFRLTLEPIPGAVRSVQVTAVPTHEPDPAAATRREAELDGDEPPTGPVEEFSAYLVELDPA